MCAKETTFFTISTSGWTLNCSLFSSSSHGYWDMHHFICQFCHTDCMLKVLKLTQSQLACVRKKQHFSQSLPRGEHWTVLRLALAHRVTEICTTSFVNFVIPEGAKINAESTCACAKETTFFTISTSGWTLNCSPFSSSSHGYWDMHHFICQFCHTDCMLKLTQSQLARVRKKQHFSQSLPRGELWTVLRLALAHTVTEICTTSFVNFVILIVCWRC